MRYLARLLGHSRTLYIGVKTEPVSSVHQQWPVTGTDPASSRLPPSLQCPRQAAPSPRTRRKRAHFAVSRR